MVTDETNSNQNESGEPNLAFIVEGDFEFVFRQADFVIPYWGTAWSVSDQVTGAGAPAA